MNMNVYGDDNSRCYFHPKEAVVGVCALCLNEKLLILASKQGHHRSNSSARDRDRDCHHRTKVATDKKPPITLPKIFALGSFLNRFEFRHWKSDVSDEHDACSSSQEDSFISIKFEDNGVASWEKAGTGVGTVSKVSLEHCSSISWKPSLTKEAANNKEPKENKSVIEHAKPRASLRWRKRIGHLFQLVRWKRSSKGNVCHVDGVKVRKGWIRTLTKRGPKNKGIV